MLRKIENLQSSVPMKSLSFDHTIMQWWKSLTRNMAYKLLDIAQHGNDAERLKALRSLYSLKHLKGVLHVSLISIICYINFLHKHFLYC